MRLFLSLLALCGGCLVFTPTARAEDDLTEVVGMEEFPGNPRERAMLARNGFVVLPRVHRQMFSLYIGGKLSYYITCDSAHRTYHVLFEATLEGLEKKYARTLAGFVQGLHGRLLALPKEARGRDLALQHVAVSARLLGADVAHPAEMQAPVTKTVAQIEAAQGQGACPLFGVRDDFALYLPRSLYAGSDALRRYFRAVTWMARRGFRAHDDEETWAALRIAAAIEGDEKLKKFHGDMDAMLTWLVGPADDLTVYEYAGALPKDGLDEASFARAQAHVQGLREPEINAAMLAPDAWRAFRAQTKGLRILPSRRTPDAWLFQKLNESVPGHGSPEGLEVAAALGSARALSILAARDETGANTAAQIGKLKGEFTSRIDGTLYGQTLRTAQLLFRSDTPLAGHGTMPKSKVPVPQVPAAPLRTSAWKDRLLASGLSGWASLRHAFALHAKNVAHMLSAAEGKTGVVEPAPEYFAALAGLARTVHQRGLAAGAFSMAASRDQIRKLCPLLDKVATGVMPSEEEVVKLIAFDDALKVLMAAHGDANTLERFSLVADRLRAWLNDGKSLSPEELSALQGGAISEIPSHWTEFAALMDELAGIATTQLAGKPLSEAQARVIERYGVQSGPLNLFYGNSYMAPQRQMGLVVDVGSNPRAGTYREVGVGGAMELYLVLPWTDGTRRLYRGAVYSYYEFDARRPVTDETWQQRIEARNTPSMPRWTGSFAGRPDVYALLAAVLTGKPIEELANVYDERIGQVLLARFRASGRAGGKYVAWLAGSLERYGTGPLRAQIIDALFDKLVTGNKGRGTVMTGWALRTLADDAIRDRAVALLAKPPEGGHAELRERAALLLERIGGDDLVPRLRELLGHTSATVRHHAVGLLADPVRWRPGKAQDARAVILAEHLAREAHAEVQLYTLELLRMLAKNLPRAHVPAIAKFLGGPTPAHRIHATEVLGVMGPASADAATKLLANLGDPAAKVAAAAAEAVGTVLRGSKDAALLQRTIHTLGARFATGGWRLRVACLDGLGKLRTPAAAAVIARVATNPDYEVRLRRIAVDDLGKAGTVALPHLYALCFDETPTGDGDALLCDVVIDTLIEVLDRADSSDFHEGLGPDPKAKEKRLALRKQYRAEARTLGHGPK